MRSSMESGESIRGYIVESLVAFLEKNHGLAINDEDVVPANLDSIDNLVGFVSRKRRMV
jgi:acyl carrier protein